MRAGLVVAALVAACGGARDAPEATDDSDRMIVDEGEPDADEYGADDDHPSLGAQGVARPWPTDAPGLVRRLQCNRCHAGTSRDPAPQRACVNCHREILAHGYPGAPAEEVARWREHLVSLVETPSLAGVGARLRRAWVRDLLLSPGDVRPALPATMPRLPLSTTDADLLAAYLVPVEAPAVTFDPALAARGAELYRRLGCATCHRFTGAGVEGPVDSARPPAAVALAPDLAFTRERFQSGALLPFLRAPRTLAPAGLMPMFPLADDDRRALASFIMTTPLAPAPPAPVPERLPVLDREVRFAEVEARVLRKVCWHCHATAAYALGDGGVGNTGGFGYRGRGLDLSSPSGVFSGAIGDDGRRRSVLAPMADGTPRLVAHLLARQQEVAGRPVPGVTGMPLGLPPLSPEEIQLVESWIEQGRRL